MKIRVAKAYTVQEIDEEIEKLTKRVVETLDFIKATLEQTQNSKLKHRFSDSTYSRCYANLIYIQTDIEDMENLDKGRQRLESNND